MRWNAAQKAIFISLLVFMTFSGIGMILIVSEYFNEPEPYIPPDLGVRITLETLEVDKGLPAYPLIIEIYWDEENRPENGIIKEGWICDTQTMASGVAQTLTLMTSCVIDTPDEPHNVSVTYCAFYQDPQQRRAYYDLYSGYNTQSGCMTYYNFPVYGFWDFTLSADGLNDADDNLLNGNLTVRWEIYDRNTG